MTVIGCEAFDIQPEAESVKVKVAVPALTPVTMPALLTEATLLLLLVQTPPDEGVKLEVAPTQMAGFPDTMATGFDCTIKSDD